MGSAGRMGPLSSTTSLARRPHSRTTRQPLMRSLPVCRNRCVWTASATVSCTGGPNTGTRCGLTTGYSTTWTGWSGSSCCTSRPRSARSVTSRPEHRHDNGLDAPPGLAMATRGGDLDPGILLYLQREHGVSLEQIDHTLNRECGLLGLSGVSDMKTLLEQADAPAVQLAIEVFCYRAAKGVGAMARRAGRVRPAHLHGRHRGARGDDPGADRRATRVPRRPAGRGRQPSKRCGRLACGERRIDPRHSHRRRGADHPRDGEAGDPGRTRGWTLRFHRDEGVRDGGTSASHQHLSKQQEADGCDASTRTGT